MRKEQEQPRLRQNYPLRTIAPYGYFVSDKYEIPPLWRNANTPEAAISVDFAAIMIPAEYKVEDQPLAKRLGYFGLKAAAMPRKWMSLSYSKQIPSSVRPRYQCSESVPRSARHSRLLGPSFNEAAVVTPRKRLTENLRGPDQ